LSGIGYWTAHAVIVAGLVGMLLIWWLDAMISEMLGTLAAMTFGMAILFAFAG
jgi:hypothetical protein